MTQTRYIRHTSIKSLPALKVFFKQRRFVLDYEKIKSADPDAYKGKSAKQAMIRLGKFCNEGGMVAADYSALKTGYMLIGFISPGSKIEILSAAGYGFYKAVTIENAKEISCLTYPVLLSRRPRMGGVLSDWSDVRPVLEAAYHGKALPPEAKSLSSSQLEILCYEYLRETGRLTHLLLPIGRSLPNIDILGIFENGNRVAAQVTFSEDTKNLSEKWKALAQYRKNFSRGYFFSPMQPALSESANIEWISTDRVFSYFFKQNHALLQAMLNPKVLK